MVADSIAARERRQHRQRLRVEALHDVRAGRRAAALRFIVAYEAGHVGLLPRCRASSTVELLSYVGEVVVWICLQIARWPRVVRNKDLLFSRIFVIGERGRI